MDIYEIESKDLENYFIEFKNYIKNCEYVRMYSYKRRKLWNKKSIRRGKDTKRKILKLYQNI